MKYKVSRIKNARWTVSLNKSKLRGSRKIKRKEAKHGMGDSNYSAAALYEGGWRHYDVVDLIAEYDLSESETQKLCEELWYIYQQHERVAKIDGGSIVAFHDDDPRISVRTTDGKSYPDAILTRNRMLIAYDKELSRWKVILDFLGNIEESIGRNIEHDNQEDY